MKELVLFLGCIFFLSSCGCRTYLIVPVEKPIVTYSKGSHWGPLCKDTKIMVGMPKSEDNFIGTYKLPNDSIETGYFAVIAFDNGKEEIRVGEDSEFEVEKCKFRVLEVAPYHHYDSLTNDISGESITLQIIASPKFCPCQNARLKEYEEGENE
jgi:hypothetical protein